MGRSNIEKMISAYGRVRAGQPVERVKELQLVNAERSVAGIHWTGIYEAHIDVLGESWCVLNVESGDEQCKCGSREQAIESAHRLNYQAIIARATSGLLAPGAPVPQSIVEMLILADEWEHTDAVKAKLLRGDAFRLYRRTWVKLSGHQRRLLFDLRAGWELLERHHEQRGYSLVLSKDGVPGRISFTTLHILDGRGLIAGGESRLFDDGYRVRTYTLTSLGRELLASAGEISKFAPNFRIPRV